MAKSTAQTPALSLLQSPIAWLGAFWKFSRPHTIIGTSFSVLGLFTIAWATRHPLGFSPGTFHIWQGLSALWLTWLACICANVYIVGLNQIEDVAIDQVNKPYLPVASGEFSLSQARMLVGLAFGSALLLAFLSHSLYLIATVWLSLAIGTAYSLPPLRLKRFPFMASFCILAVRGAVVNLGLYLHAESQLGLLPRVPARVWLLAVFILVFSIAIAIFKDIPDIEGDRRYGITTFSVTLGQRSVFRLAQGLLTGCYAAVIALAIFIPGVNPLVLISTHGILLISLWYVSFQVSLDGDPAPGRGMSYAQFYQFIWKLFFIEYLVFPAACLMHQL